METIKKVIAAVAFFLGGLVFVTALIKMSLGILDLVLMFSAVVLLAHAAWKIFFSTEEKKVKNQLPAYTGD